MLKIVILTKQNFGARVLRILLLVSVFVMSLLSVTSSLAKQSSNNIHSSNNSTPLRIAVAANFTPVLKVLLKDFTKQTGIKSQIISGASGAMFIQIKHGAPFDVFLSADSRRPQALEQSGYGVKNSRKTYAIGQLALYSSTLNSLDQAPIEQTSLNNPSLEQRFLGLLKNPPDRFAIANPDIAPYGKAAKEALIHLGLWQRYEPRLIKGINIGQTFAQLHSKAIASGIVANSQLVLNNLSGIIIPSNYHQSIEQQLIIIQTSKQKTAAERLSKFLLSPQSQKAIVSYGYAQAKQVNSANKKVKRVN